MGNCHFVLIYNEISHNRDKQTKQALDLLTVRSVWLSGWTPHTHSPSSAMVCVMSWRDCNNTWTSLSVYLLTLLADRVWSSLTLTLSVAPLFIMDTAQASLSLKLCTQQLPLIIYWCPSHRSKYTHHPGRCSHWNTDQLSRICDWNTSDQSHLDLFL